MPSIAALIEDAEPIELTAACGTMLDRFLDNPGCDLLVVAQSGRPLGVVSRAAPQAHDAERTAAQIMTPAVTADAGMPLNAACELILAHRDPVPGLVVMQDGRYAGVVSTRVLLGCMASRAGAGYNSRHFIEMVDHELRGPLNGLLTVADLLQRQPLSMDSQAHVRSIQESGQTALRALDDALQLSRMEGGQLAFDLRPAELRTFMDDVHAAWEARAAENGMTLLVAYDGEPDLKAVIDVERLKQVFDKLIETALITNRRGMVEASLKAESAADGVRLTGRVRDTGGGLAGFDLNADTAGPGMALCLGIVERMNGSIRADNNVGVGATIVFDYCAGQAIPDADGDEHDGVDRAAHILVVDDNATNRMVAEALCEMFDCTSECVEDGVEAVAAAETGRFDLILMDIRMPRMDGVEATKAIRAFPGAAGRVPIIALTANADPDDAKGYLAAGMQGVVEKPLKPERLLEAINEALSGYHRAAAA